MKYILLEKIYQIRHSLSNYSNYLLQIVRNTNFCHFKFVSLSTLIVVLYLTVCNKIKNINIGFILKNFLKLKITFTELLNYEKDSKTKAFIVYTVLLALTY